MKEKAGVSQPKSDGAASKDSGHEERDLQLWRRKFDDLKSKTQIKAEHLTSLHEKLQEQEKINLKTNKNTQNANINQPSGSSAQKQTDTKNGN